MSRGVPVSLRPPKASLAARHKKTHEIVKILIDYRPALRHRTGVGVWVSRLIEALAEGHAGALDITAFSSSWKDRFTAALPRSVRQVDRRVPVRVLNWLWHRQEWPPVELLAAGPFDVVHSPSPLLIPTNGAASLVTIHDVDFLMHPERSDGEIQRDYPPLAREHAHRADAIVVPSLYTRDQVARCLNVSTDCVFVCPNGAPDWALRASPRPGGHLLFVGSIAPRKNVGRLLQAYDRLRQICPAAPQLVLAGQPATDADQLLATLRQPRFAGCVRHEGYVSEERLKSLYADASAVVLPSLDEGFGIPALEAMTVGVPLVAARRGALPDLVSDAALLVNPLDVEELSKAMQAVVTDPELRERLSQAGPKRARKFTWRASANVLHEAYLFAIEHRRLSRETNDAHRD